MTEITDKKDFLDRIPAFSVVLIFVILVIIGAANIPLLNIQYNPTEKKNFLSISYSWSGASARVIESEVTSKIEGIASSVKGIEKINSTSRKGSGNVNMTLKKDANVEMVRFEIATLIRQLYPKFPDGVTYPSFGRTSASGETMEAVMTYTINANLPTQQIEQYTMRYIVDELSLMEGISSVDLSGANPFYVEILFDPYKINSYSLSINDITTAIGSAFRNESLGFIDVSEAASEELALILKGDGLPGEYENIPIKSVNGRIIYIKDVAEISYKERLPRSYYRINGLNTINVAIYPEKSVNTLNLCNDIKDKMASLSQQFPEDFSAIVVYDASIELNKELRKIIKRTFFSVLILLVFVLLVSRSLKYLFVITITLIANIFIAFIFYNLLDLEIHLYSLAGITVSLGLIIDTTIIMISHYSYYHNRKAFLAILGALLTSIGSLLVVFFLPEEMKGRLLDFSAVIIVNLTISLTIALVFVPAFLTKFPVYPSDTRSSVRTRRLVVRFSNWYQRFINFGVRYRWIYIVVFILGFGIPLHLLPDKITVKKGDETNVWVEAYNKTIGSSFYQKKLKKPLEYTLGGSLRLFSKKSSGFNFSRQPQRPRISVNAKMPEGCNVQQLNEIMLVMENYIAQFEEVERFTTRISSYSSGNITITFKEEYENTAFPANLQAVLTAKAIDCGGANWTVYGIDNQYFNNNLSSGYKSWRVNMTGYNYDDLYGYCTQLVEKLSQNKRVSEPAIYGAAVEYSSTLSRNEYYIDYNLDNLAIWNINPAEAFVSLRNNLYSATVSSFFDGEATVLTALKSANADEFDIWSLENEYTDYNGKRIRFSELGVVEMRSTGNDIYKENQQYRLVVAWDYIGAQEAGKRELDKRINELNDEILPIGYNAKTSSYDFGSKNSQQYLLLFLVIIIIYFICAILFESLIKPFAIISLIPLSFIGLFLIFYFSKVVFDSGGFASMIMLAGLTVNSGIYIVNEFNLTNAKKGRYVKAYNHKIIPIMLTILSTVLGLIPFLFDGPTEVFWYAFALGNIGGLAFSIIALFVYLPIFITPKSAIPPRKVNPKRKIVKRRKNIGIEEQ